MCQITKMKNTQSKIKSIEIRKQPATRPEKMKWKIKYLEKNLTVLFADQINQDLKEKINNWCYKNKIKTYCVKCRKDTENIDQKMVITD